MNILITGSTGFLGGVLRKELSKFHSIFELFSDQGVRIDISKPFQIDFPVKLDLVIHAAGKAHSVPKTESESRSFHEINYNGTVNLLNALDNSNQLPNSFIYISSVAVYGVESGYDLTEKEPLLGQTPYARSKIAAEKYVQTFCKANNIKSFIFRLPLIIGPNPPGNLGDMIKGIKNGFYLQVGDGNFKKSVVLGKDICQLVEKIRHFESGIYNLTDNNGVTFHNLAVALAVKFNKRKPLKIPIFIARLLANVGDLLGERFPINSLKLKKITSDLTFSCDKAKRDLNWQPLSVVDSVNEIDLD